MPAKFISRPTTMHYHSNLFNIFFRIENVACYHSKKWDNRIFTIKFIQKNGSFSISSHSKEEKNDENICKFNNRHFQWIDFRFFFFFFFVRVNWTHVFHKAMKLFNQQRRKKNVFLWIKNWMKKVGKGRKLQKASRIIGWYWTEMIQTGTHSFTHTHIHMP